METLNLSIKSDIEKMRDSFQRNAMCVSGNGSSQVMGSGNKVNVHANR